MTARATELYRPRKISNRGIWDLGDIQFKIYDLLADGRTVSDEVIKTAENFLRRDVLIAALKMGDSNGLGFVIIHAGDLGITIAAHWWAQGSVLCQRIYRHQYADALPLDTIDRPAVACVWELDIIAAEQIIWRETMKNPQPETSTYLKGFVRLLCRDVTKILAPFMQPFQPHCCSTG